MVQLILPRAEADLPRTVQAVEKLRLPLTVLPVPVAHITFTPFTLPPQTQGLIFTSPQGVRAAVNAHTPRLPAWCVGTATAQAAEQAGFPLAGIGPSHAAAMAQSMCQANVTGLWAHLTAPHGTKGWYATTGTAITPLMAYTLTPVEELPPATRAALAPAAQRIGMGFSPTMLRTWQTLLARAKLQPEPQGIAISPAVARLAPPTWRTATHPSLAGMLAQLKEMLP